MPGLPELTLAPQMECSADLSSVGLASDSSLNALEGLFCLLCPLRSALSPGSSTQGSVTMSTAPAHHADVATIADIMQMCKPHSSSSMHISIA